MSAVRYEPAGRVAHIVLNRPEKLNALSAELRDEFDEALNRFVADPGVRVAVIRGEGRAFCAGGDVSPGSKIVAPGGVPQPPDVVSDWKGIGSGMEHWLRIWDAPKPVIAAVHGYCIGVGTYIPMFCDLTYVADDAKIGFPSMPLGAGVGAPLWSWLVGPKVAKAFSFRPGLHMTAREAVSVGWANASFPADTFLDEVQAIAEEMGRAPLEMLHLQKKAINRVWDSQGFRASVLAGAEWDAVAHQVSELQTVREWIAELGVSGAARRYREQGL